MKASFCLILFVSLLFFINLSAESWNFNEGFSSSGNVSMIYQSPGGVGMIFKMGKLNINNIIINNHLMKSIVIPELYGPGDPGKPFFPTISRLVAVPQGASASVQILNSNTHEISVVVPWCSPESLPYNNVNSVIFKPDSSVYFGNRPYPEQIIRVSEPFKIRGLDVVQVTIEPFQWDPRDSVLTVYTSVNLNISFIGGNGHFGEDRLRSRYWDRIYSCNVINLGTLWDIDYSKRVIEKQSLVDAGYPYGAEFVIIVPDDESFIDAAETIKDLRQEEGIITEIYTLTEIGSSFEEIEYWIDNAYYSWIIPPEAILLLSDCKDVNFTEGIPSKKIDQIGNGFTTWASDNYYADVDGDYLPDIAVGRIPARNQNDLDNIIGKVQHTELNPTNYSGFYSNVLVSGTFVYDDQYGFHLLSEVTRGFYENNLEKNVIRLYKDYPDTVIPDTLNGYPWVPGGVTCHTPGMIEYFSSLGYLTDSITEDFLISSIWNKNASDINNTIENGCFIVYNHAHGGVGDTISGPIPSHWSQPWYSVWDLNNLNNYGDKIPYVYALGCWVGKFDDTLIGGYRHHSEHFMFLPPNVAGLKRGAIGITSASYQWGDAGSHFFGFLDFMYPNFDPMYPFFEDDTSHQALPGFALVSGKIYMKTRNTNWYCGNDAIKKFHHFGDPYLRLFTEVPDNLTVSIFPILQAGVDKCYITATYNSMITLIANGEIIGRKTAGIGQTSVDIVPQDTGTEVEIVVTKQNYRRYYDTLFVSPTSGPYLRYIEIDTITGGYGNIQINPGQNYQIKLELSNFGTSSANDPWLELTSSDSNITIDPTSFSTKKVNSYDTILVPFDFHISLDAEDRDSIPMTFRYSYSGADTFTEYLYLLINAPVLENYVYCTGKRFPGENFYMRLSLENQGTGTAYNPIARITIDHSKVTFNALDTIFDTLDFGYCDTIDSAFYFNVSIEPESFWVMYDSLLVPCSLFITTSDSLFFSDTFSIQLADPVILYDGFEEGVNWTYTYGSEVWDTTSLSSHTGDMSMYNGQNGYYSSDVTNARVISGSILQPCSDEYYILSYWHKYYLEPSNDGVHVQMRVDTNGSWITLSPKEGYTGISNGYGGFDLGDLIYTDTQTTWQKQNIMFEYDEVPPAKPMYICWRFGSNDTIVQEGYYFDEVLLFRYPDTTGEEESVIEENSILQNYDFNLFSVYPSIISNRAVISYSIGDVSDVKLIIYDVSGREVVNLVNTQQSPGIYRVEWNGRNNNNIPVSSGIYFYRLEVEGFEQANKLTIVR